jgi:hypothetical protein
MSAFVEHCEPRHMADDRGGIKAVKPEPIGGRIQIITVKCGVTFLWHPTFFAQFASMM